MQQLRFFLKAISRCYSYEQELKYRLFYRRSVFYYQQHSVAGLVVAQTRTWMLCLAFKIFCFFLFIYLIFIWNYSKVSYNWSMCCKVVCSLNVGFFFFNRKKRLNKLLLSELFSRFLKGIVLEKKRRN